MSQTSFQLEYDVPKKFSFEVNEPHRLPRSSQTRGFTMRSNFELP